MKSIEHQWLNFVAPESGPEMVAPDQPATGSITLATLFGRLCAAGYTADAFAVAVHASLVQRAVRRWLGERSGSYEI